MLLATKDYDLVWLRPPGHSALYTQMRMDRDTNNGRLVDDQFSKRVLRPAARRMLDFELRDAGRPEPRVAVGEWVKVGLPHERFWIRLTEILPDGTIKGRVDNDLVFYKTDLREVSLHRCNILESAGDADLEDFLHLRDGSESLRQAALSWRSRRLQSGVCAEPRPNTDFVTAG